MCEIKDQKTNLKDCLDKDQKEHLDKNGRFCWFIGRLWRMEGFASSLEGFADWLDKAYLLIDFLYLETNFLL
jgi:hypothetical protein